MDRTHSPIATDSEAALHDKVGDDATATFEDDPKFLDSDPTGTPSSENIEEQRNTGDIEEDSEDDLEDVDEEDLDDEDDEAAAGEEDEEDEEDEDVDAAAQEDDDAGDVEQGVDEDELDDAEENDMDTDQVADSVLRTSAC